MSLIGRLKNSLALLVLAGSMLPFSFGNSQSLHSQEESFWKSKDEVYEDKRDKKLALALITLYDPPKASVGMEEMFKNNFSNIPDYELFTQRTRGIQGLIDAIKNHSKSKPIDALILAYHGEKSSFIINESEEINYSNVERIFEEYKNLFSKEAIIILYSCATGSGEDNIAKRLSNALNRDVVAPKYGLIPETYLESWQRINEFSLDENGRIAFDYNNFKRYYEPLWRRSSNSVATYSYKIFKAKKVIGENGKACFFFSDKNPE